MTSSFQVRPPAGLRLAAVGLVSLLGQVVLLRELLVAFFGSELIFILALGILLPCTALGVAAGGAAGEASSAKVSGLFLLFAILLPSLLVTARSARLLLSGTPGAFLSFPRQLLVMVMLMLPFGFLCGLLFHRAAVVTIGKDGTLAGAYAVEALGSLGGGALATIGSALGVSNLAMGFFCALAAAAAACLSPSAGRSAWLRRAGVSLSGILLVGLAFSGPVDRWLTSLNHPALVTAVDTPYARIAVTKRAGQVAVFENDALAFESQGLEAERFATLAALECGNPSSCLVLCDLPEGLVGEVLRHRPRRVDVVALDRRAFRLALEALPRRWGEAYRAPGVSLRFQDPRRFVAETDNRYDLVLVAASEPSSGRTNRFYTREFFQGCASRLTPGGVVALRLRSSENLWTRAVARRSASIHGALASVFPHTLLFPGTMDVLVASRLPLVRDPGVLSQRLRRRKIHTRLVTPAFLHYLLTNDRFEDAARRLAVTHAVENTDARPVCYSYTLVLWLTRFFPSVGSRGFPLSGLFSEWGIAFSGACAFLFLLASLACRRSVGCRRCLLTALAGFGAMVMEGAVILWYQGRRGALFKDLGLLLAAFMAGLAAGSLLLDLLSRKARGNQPDRRTGLLLAGGLAILSLGAARLFGAGGDWGLPTAVLLTSAAGASVGGIFGYAALRWTAGQGAIVAPLYSADLAGACLGSLAASLFLLPVLGLPASAVAVVLVALAAAVLV